MTRRNDPLRALCAASLSFAAFAWLARVPDVFGFTLGRLSERFGGVTWFGAGAVLAVTLVFVRTSTWIRSIALVVATVAVWFGGDLFVTRRHAGLMVIAAVVATELAAHVRPKVAAAGCLLGAAAAAGMQYLDGLPYRTSLPPIESTVARADAPDIVLVTLDTTRYDALEAMPNLRAFADGALVFTNATAEASHTHPSMASLVTSLTPLDHGSVSGSPAMFPDVSTLAMHLRANGYRTAGFLDNPWLGPEFGLAQGYEHLQRQAEISDIERWLRKDDGRPAFLHVHLFHPHGPYELRPDALGPLGLAVNPEAEARLGRSVSAEFIRTHEEPSAAGLLEPGDVEWMHTIYLTEIYAMDRWLADLFALIETRAEAIVAVAADHGEEFGDHGGLHHAHTLEDELIHVPLMLRAPGVSPSTIDAPVGLIDVAPTLLALAGLPPLPGALGQVLTGTSLATKPRLSTRLNKNGVHLVCVRDGSTRVQVEVSATLDLALDDPAWPEGFDASSPLGAALAEHLAAARARRSRVRHGRGHRAVEMTKSKLDELRALGY